MFTLVGKSTNCSREYVRAWLHASSCVLAFHGKVLPGKVTVRITQLPPGLLGQWDAEARTISLDRELDPEMMATTILHEMIHAACGDFGEGTDEKCCSTLSAKLKPDVHTLAQTLVDGTYRRAAYFAHTKLTYITDQDHYDPAEDEPIGVEDRYRRSP